MLFICVYLNVFKFNVKFLVFIDKCKCKMKNCVVCKKNANKPSFRVPKCEKRMLKWAAICGMALTPNSRLCIDHFSQSQIITAGRNHRLMPNAEPVLQNQQNEGLGRVCININNI